MDIGITVTRKRIEPTQHDYRAYMELTAEIAGKLTMRISEEEIINCQADIPVIKSEYLARVFLDKILPDRHSINYDIDKVMGILLYHLTEYAPSYIVDDLRHQINDMHDKLLIKAVVL